MVLKCLDVFKEEPLPEDSELWKLKNIPDNAAHLRWSPYYADRVIDMFCENHRRYLTSRPMINVVDERAGY